MRSTLAIGRVLRLEDLGQFTTDSGLAGRTSDWLVGLQAQIGGLSITDRALIDEDFSVTRHEVRLAYARPTLSISTSHLWLQADQAEGRPLNTSEWALDASYAINSSWSGRVNWLYDHVAARGTNAGLGLRYQGDCVTLDLSVSRRFTSSAAVTPTTDFGLAVDLSGFGGSATGQPARRTCR